MNPNNNSINNPSLTINTKSNLQLPPISPPLQTSVLVPFPISSAKGPFKPQSTSHSIIQQLSNDIYKYECTSLIPGIELEYEEIIVCLYILIIG